MSSTPCKSLKKDGTPCRGNGLEQLDGYCIAHAPAGQSLGVALTRRQGLVCRRPRRQTHTRPPVATPSINCPPASTRSSKASSHPPPSPPFPAPQKVLIELYRLADHEMDLIRSEETAAAAAQVAGAAGDPELLDAAAAIAAWQDQYRIRLPHRPGPCRARTCRNARRRPTTGPRPDRRRPTALRLPATDQVHKEGYRRLQRTGDRQPF